MNTQLKSILARRLAKKGKKVNGFTLIELMVVVAIVGILSGVGLPQLLKAQDKAKDSVTLATLTNAAKECSLTLVTENSGDSFDADAQANYNLVEGDTTNSLNGACDFNDSLTLTSHSGDGTKVASVSFDEGGIPGVAGFAGDDEEEV